MIATRADWVKAGVGHNSGPGDSGSGLVSVLGVCVSEWVVVCFFVRYFCAEIHIYQH